MGKSLASFALLVCLCYSGLGPGSVAVSLGLNFSNLNMQMLNIAIWDNLMLERHLQLLLRAVFWRAVCWNSDPESKPATAIHTVKEDEV